MSPRWVKATAVYVARLDQEEAEDKFADMRAFVEEHQTLETDVEIQFRAADEYIAWFVIVRQDVP